MTTGLIKGLFLHYFGPRNIQKSLEKVIICHKILCSFERHKPRFRWSGNITSVLTVGFFAHLQSVLHFMTGYTSSEESAAVSQDVVCVLVLSGLMKW